MGCWRSLGNDIFADLKKRCCLSYQPFTCHHRKSWVSKALHSLKHWKIHYLLFTFIFCSGDDLKPYTVLNLDSLLGTVAYNFYDRLNNVSYIVRTYISTWTSYYRVISALFKADFILKHMRNVLLHEHMESFLLSPIRDFCIYVWCSDGTRRCTNQSLESLDSKCDCNHCQLMNSIMDFQ